MAATEYVAQLNIMESSTGNQGGRRAGAGRKPGSVNRMTAAAREAAAASGLLPHEILLSMARGEPQYTDSLDMETGEITRRWHELSVEERRDAAKAASPYYAPKMSTVEVLKTGTDDELDAIIKELADQAGISLSTGGEEPEDGSEGSAECISASDGSELGKQRSGRRSF